MRLPVRPRYVRLMHPLRTHGRTGPLPEGGWIAEDGTVYGAPYRSRRKLLLPDKTSRWIIPKTREEALEIELLTEAGIYVPTTPFHYDITDRNAGPYPNEGTHTYRTFNTLVLKLLRSGEVDPSTTATYGIPTPLLPAIHVHPDLEDFPGLLVLSTDRNVHPLPWEPGFPLPRPVRKLRAPAIRTVLTPVPLDLPDLRILQLPCENPASP